MPWTRPSDMVRQCMGCGRLPTAGRFAGKAGWDDEIKDFIERFTGHPLTGHFEPGKRDPQARVYYGEGDEPLGPTLCPDCWQADWDDWQAERAKLAKLAGEPPAGSENEGEGEGGSAAS